MIPSGFPRRSIGACAVALIGTVLLGAVSLLPGGRSGSAVQAANAPKPGRSHSPARTIVEQAFRPLVEDGSHVSIVVGTIEGSWHVLNANGEEIVWHNGGTAGYSTVACFCRKRRVGLVALSNSAEPGNEEPLTDAGLLALAKMTSPTAPSSTAPGHETPGPALAPGANGPSHDAPTRP